jgi:DNA repair exonuclease SbcCD ATPase subunit
MKLTFVEVAGFRGFRDRTRFEIPAGFAVLVGRNGVGKSTLFDAIDFVLTGTINKFDVVNAKGGGLNEHIWWVGHGRPQEHYATVGFVDDAGKEHVFRRDRDGPKVNPADITRMLCATGDGEEPSVETLMQTSLIRDELIVALSLDLPEQQRFAAVRAAIGGIVGPDHSERTGALVRAAAAHRDSQERRFIEAQAEQGRSLGALTEARSAAEKSTDVAEALRIIESMRLELPPAPAARAQAIRRLIADRRQALTDLEGARQQAVAVLPAHQRFNSAEGKEEAQILQLRLAEASREFQDAASAKDAASRVQKAEQDADAFAAHLSAIVEHGHALGLQDGHCPLCNAMRTDAEFADALAAARTRLAEQGRRLVAAAAEVDSTAARFALAKRALTDAEEAISERARLAGDVVGKLASVTATYKLHGIDAPADDPDSAQMHILAEREKLVRLERALFILEASSAMERVQSFEVRSSGLKLRVEQEAAKLAAAETASNLAKQIDSAAKMVANEILTEQFDTVMPLLKELYRRLRPHSGWTEIESDFGGKVRGSLNFKVGEGYNVQFLFSSGQRRAAGLAFLLAVHLSRRWCKWQTLMLDDPVQHIDDYRALNLVEVLSAVRRMGRQVIVAVEDEALADVLCRRLRSLPNETGRCFTLQTSTDGIGQIADTRDIYPMPREVLRSVSA